MNCPNCGSADSKVVDKRNNKENKTVRRRRECLNCEFRFTTYERVEHAHLLVRKKSGRLEEFDRNKLKTSVLKGLKKREYSEVQIDQLIDRIENSLLSKNRTIIDSKEIGKLTLQGLKTIDPVAYMLYATVYLDFDCLDDIEAELISLKSTAPALA